MCLKNLGRVITHIFSINFFLQKYMFLCILKGILPFEMHIIIFFPEKHETKSSVTSKLQ